jgi:hypothetical protein
VGCSTNLSDLRCRFRRSTQHLLGVYSLEFEIPEFFLDVDSSAARGTDLAPITQAQLDLVAKNYVFGVQPSAVVESEAKTISYWSTANGDDTMITLWNPADEAQDFLLKVLFEGGHYQLPVHLDPRVTQTVNLSEIIKTQLPDSEGNLIPLSAHEGSAQISGSLGTAQRILLVMDAATYNTQKATCGHYCMNCDGYSFGLIILTTFGVASGQNTQETFLGQYHNGTQYDLTTQGKWSTTDQTIATVNTGLVSYVNLGNFNLDSNFQSIIYNTNYCGSNVTYCPANFIYGSASGAAGAVPTRFSLNSAIDEGGGGLVVKYTWSSTTGNPDDLSKCTINELVQYPGTVDYAWPTPFPAITSQNPTPGTVPATDGELLDYHDLHGKLDTDFRKPYSNNSFNAIQKISYTCAYARVLTGTFYSAIKITRTVSPNTNGTYKFVVQAFIDSKNSPSATINPLP